MWNLQLGFCAALILNAVWALNSTATYTNSTSLIVPTSSRGSTQSTLTSLESASSTLDNTKASSSKATTTESQHSSAFAAALGQGTVSAHSVFAPSGYVPSISGVSGHTPSNNETTVLSKSSPATASTTGRLTSNETTTGAARIQSMPTGYLPSSHLLGAHFQGNTTNGTQTTEDPWEAAQSCNAEWNSWSSEYITSTLTTGPPSVVSYTYSWNDFVTPQNVTPYTTLCDGYPRASGLGSYSWFTESDSYTAEGDYHITTTLPHTTKPVCSIPAEECGRLYASALLGGLRGDIACSSTCIPKYHTTWLGRDLPPCYIFADELQLAYWPVEMEGDLCGNRTTVTPTMADVVPTAITWGTTIASPGVLVSFHRIWAQDQCSQTIGEVLSDYILSQQSTQISSQCGAYHQGGFNPTQVNFANFNTPVPAAAYKCQPQCGNGVGGMENFCQTFYDNYNPQMAFPTDVFNIRPEWKSCTITPTGNMVNDPPVALTQANAPAMPTVPTGDAGITTPAAPQQPPASTPRPTGDADVTTPATPQQPPTSPPRPTGVPVGTEKPSPAEPSEGGDQGGNGDPDEDPGSGSEPGSDGGTDPGDDGGSGNGGDPGGNGDEQGSGDGGSNDGGSNDGGASGDDGNDDGGSNSGGGSESDDGGTSDGDEGGSDDNGGGSSNNGGANDSQGSDDNEGGGSSNSGGGSSNNEGSSDDGGSSDGNSGGAGGVQDGSNGQGGGSGSSADNAGGDADPTRNVGAVIISLLNNPTGLPGQAGGSAEFGSNLEPGGRQVTSGAVVQIGGQQATVAAAGAPSEMRVVGQTLTAGQVATISGHVIGNVNGNKIVVDGSTAAMSRITAAPVSLGAIITGASGTLTAQATDGIVVVSGQTLTPGEVRVIDGQTVSVASAALVVDGHTVAFSQLGGSTGPITEGAVFTAGSATFTAIESSGAAVIDGRTLSQGQIVTLNGQTISNAGTALVINGRTTVPFSSLTAQATLGAVFTISGQIYTATELPNGDMVVDGTTLHQGDALTIDGVRISDGINGLLVGSRTIPVSTLDLAPTSAVQPAAQTGRASSTCPARSPALCILAVMAAVSMIFG